MQLQVKQMKKQKQKKTLNAKLHKKPNQTNKKTKKKFPKKALKKTQTQKNPNQTKKKTKHQNQTTKTQRINRLAKLTYCKERQTKPGDTIGIKYFFQNTWGMSSTQTVLYNTNLAKF